jgi:hypothetical protein
MITRRSIAFVTALICLGLIIAIVLVACEDGSVEKVGETTGDYTYKLVEIEGMTCIRYTFGYAFALTCNWDEWERG